MCTPPNKCIRLDKPKRYRDGAKSQCKLNQKVSRKVLCQKDYLQVICSFMKMNDILKNVVSLSRFHCDFFNNKQQSKLINTCLNNQIKDIDSILKLLDMTLIFDNDNNNNSIYKQLEHILNDWSYWVESANNCDKLNQNTENPFVWQTQLSDKLTTTMRSTCDVFLLIKLKNVDVFKYWVSRVKYKTV